MDLYESRRHRLQPHEVEPVMQAVRSQLETMLEEEKDLFTAEALFKVLLRVEANKHGRPTYPEPIGWSLIRDWLKNGPFFKVEEDEEGE